MIRWPDAADRGSARQLYRPYFAAAVPGQPDQDVVDPRIGDHAIGLVAVAMIPGESGVGGLGIWLGEGDAGWDGLAELVAGAFSSAAKPEGCAVSGQLRNDPRAPTTLGM